MEQYLNKRGHSGIESYENGSDYIIVTFRDGIIKNYLYTYDATGIENVEKMKVLAEDGFGLNSFINKCIKNRYARKW